ncbi:MAG: hypothetical protein CL693_07185 [Cellvibrionaceae bacterium]|mgnify:CR=1 FL=1|nr:hypothetical protein [Cellvibrionaceae bacterium]|tara:strand:+ start:12051 stop:12842 length:792 start_codon:yes stop_codon:yes gene_type:complete
MAISAKIASRSSLAACLLLVLVGIEDSTAESETPVVTLKTLRQTHSGWKNLLYVENNQLSGHFRDIIDCSFESIPYEVNYGFGPFSRIQRQVENAQADGYFPANLSLQRRQYSVASNSLLTDHKLLVLAKSHTLSRNSRIAAMRGASEELALARSRSDRVFLVNSYRQLIDMLLARRIDGFVGSELFLFATKGQSELVQTTLKLPIKQSDMHAFFGKHFVLQHPEFLSRFNDSLSRCRQRIPYQLSPPQPLSESDSSGESTEN